MLFKFLYLRFKYKLLKLILLKSPNLYINPKDIISLELLSDGSYQSDICSALINSADKNKENLFVDIGANIGLISIAVNKSFNKLICIEPNDIVLNVLKSNLEISHINNYEIYNFGLSVHGSKGILYSPQNNIGGSYLLDGNMYENLPLDLTKISKRSVNLVNPLIFFENLFTSHSNYNIVVKIDVEGLEFEIIKSIIDVLPDNVSIHIVYENWYSNDIFINILNGLKRPYTFTKINSSNFHLFI